MVFVLILQSFGLGRAMILNVGLKFPTIENLCYYPERKDPQARDPNLLVGLLSNYVVCPKRPFLLFYFSIYVKLKKFKKKWP